MREVDPSDDTDVVPSPAPAENGSRKVCCVCGKDLAGHRRFKDSTGYYCKDCHKADKAANTPDERRCDGCGRKILIAKLIPWADEHICSTCHKERLSLRKKEMEKARIATIRRKHEFMGLRLWLTIFAVLSLILFLRWMKIL